jgi:hypothetical protein
MKIENTSNSSTRHCTMSNLLFCRSAAEVIDFVIL